MFGRSKAVTKASNPVVAEVSDDSELVAVLAAAVQAFIGGSAQPGRNIRVVSYRHIGPAGSVWNNKARHENLR